MGVCNADEALTPVGYVLAKPDDPNVLGFRNVSRTVMSATTPSGVTRQVKDGDIIPLKPGIRVEVFDGEIMIQ